MSAFCDNKFIYPVKISVEKYYDSYKNNSNIYMIITVGTIKKENLPFTRMQPVGESVCPEASPLKVSITELIKYFNTSECGCLIENIPDQMLSEEQQQRKTKIHKSFEKKEEILTQLYNNKAKIENEIKAIENKNDYDTNYDDYDDMEL